MYLFFLRTWSKEIYTQSMRCKNKLNLSPIILILQIFDFSLLSTNWWKFKFLSPHFELSVVFLFLYENNFQMIKCWVSTNKIEHFSTKHQKKKKKEIYHSHTYGKCIYCVFVEYARVKHASARSHNETKRSRGWRQLLSHRSWKEAFSLF